MAAMFLFAPLKFVFILVLLKYFPLDDYHCNAYAFTDGYTSFRSFIRIKRGALSLNTFLVVHCFRGVNMATCIYLPSTTDITICMDVELNPGPFISLLSTHSSSLTQGDYSAKSSCDVARVGIRSVSSVHRFVYDCTDLLRLYPLHFDVFAWN